MSGELLSEPTPESATKPSDPCGGSLSTALDATGWYPPAKSLLRLLEEGSELVGDNPRILLDQRGT